MPPIVQERDASVPEQAKKCHQKRSSFLYEINPGLLRSGLLVPCCLYVCFQLCSPCITVSGGIGDDLNGNVIGQKSGTAPFLIVMGERKWARCKMHCNAPKSTCHPERLEKIGDFQKESKDLRTDFTAKVSFVRRSFDSLRSLRMTYFGAAAFLQQPLFARIGLKKAPLSRKGWG